MPRLVDIARSYIGQQERPGNMGWYDRAFEEEMRSAGWKVRQAWCAYFVRHCVRKAGLRDLTSPSAVTTFRQYKAAGLTGNTPRIGALAVWQNITNGRATAQGHIGIVEAVCDETFGCVEGNTNATGGREGDVVAVRTRKINFAVPKNGLALLGFCYPDGEIPASNPA